MKCESCGMQISSEFAFAINNNQCPACGKQLMQAMKLASYVSLCELLKENIGYAESENQKIANLIIANFELKQIFKEEIKNTQLKSVKESAAIEVEEEQNVVIDENGIRYETFDKEKSQDLLQKMRDEALESVLNDRNDLDLINETALAEDPIANAQLIKQEQKRIAAQEAVIGGLGNSKGGFRRI
jgi:hypothetical protein